jgi:hypothetical protein
LDPELEAPGDPLRFPLQSSSEFRDEHVASSFSPQRQPPSECGCINALSMLDVDRKRLSLVAPAGQHYRGPEVLELAEMVRPIGNGLVEQRPDQIVAADADVECFHQRLEGRVINLVEHYTIFSEFEETAIAAP